MTEEVKEEIRDLAGGLRNDIVTVLQKYHLQPEIVVYVLETLKHEVLREVLRRNTGE